MGRQHPESGQPGLLERVCSAPLCSIWALRPFPPCLRWTRHPGNGPDVLLRHLLRPARCAARAVANGGAREARANLGPNWRVPHLAVRLDLLSPSFHLRRVWTLHIRARDGGYPRPGEAIHPGLRTIRGWQSDPWALARRRCGDGPAEARAEQEGEEGGGDCPAQGGGRPCDDRLRRTGTRASQEASSCGGPALAGLMLMKRPEPRQSHVSRATLRGPAVSDGRSGSREQARWEARPASVGELPATWEETKGGHRFRTVLTWRASSQGPRCIRAARPPSPVGSLCAG